MKRLVTWNMKLFVNWIRLVFCDFDMFADWKSFGLCVNGLLVWIIIIDMSLGCIEGVALLLLICVVAVSDATIEIIRWSIAIVRHINRTRVEVSLLCGIANVIGGDFLHLISGILCDVSIRIVVCSVCVAAWRVIANIERLLRVCSRRRHMTQITGQHWHARQTQQQHTPFLQSNKYTER